MRKRPSRALIAVLAAIGFFLFAFTPPATAQVSVRINISAQVMEVAVEGAHYATWKISSARDGYWTPRGKFRPYLLRRMHYSSLYENSPMPHSIFFKGNFAIHATEHVKRLGRPASHGCIRLAPKNAAQLYALVRTYGMKGTRILITN
jgi:lipoprotein-anchoring transpeptidase ErfK/SrfK